MSDDLLERATRALREEGGAEPSPEQSAMMRARLLSQTKRSAQLRPQGVWQWAAVVCLGFFATTAMAHVIRVQLPRVIEALREPAGPPPPPAAAKKQRAARPVQPKAAVPEAPVVQEAPVAPAPEIAPSATPEQANAPVVPAPPSVTEQAHAVAPATPQRRAPARAPRPAQVAPPRVTVAPPAPAAPPPPVAALPEEEPLPAPTVMPPTAAASKAPAAESAELALFRRAQALHLKHDRSAIEAWDAYLRVAGTTALAPEARYNRALGLVRANRYAEAKKALAPFAEGKYGSYRKQEAQSLLARLPK